MDSHGEDHYMLVRPDEVWRVSRGSRRRLRNAHAATNWAEPGEGRVAAAGEILGDATQRGAGPPLAVAFCRDVLDHYCAQSRLTIAVREVEAWRAERELEVEAQALRTPVPQSLPEMLAQADAALRGGPWSSWLAVYRAISGVPDIPDDTAANSGAGGSAGAS
jgi:hypothetical protein